MEVGQTGTVFVPGKPFELGEFMACKILEVQGEKLRVELENGATGIIEKTEFTPRYMVIPSNAELCGGPSGPSERAPGYASAAKTEE